MSTVRLSTTSYAVLGLVETCGEATPYQLEQAGQACLLHFWSIPHTQLYSESARLAEAGLLAESREADGRRRRFYSLTEAGRTALDAWRADPEADLYELRDPGLLKLFCGAPPAPLAAAQIARHTAQLHEYQRLVAEPDAPEPLRLVASAGIGHTREYIRFWSTLAGDPDADR